LQLCRQRYRDLTRSSGMHLARVYENLLSRCALTLLRPFPLHTA
jgi:hypothetical protein